MEEIKNEFKLGGLFDGNISKDDLFIQEIRIRFLTDTNKYLTIDKPDDWFCSQVFNDYQYRNKNQIKDLSWIRHPDTFKFYFNVTNVTNENLVYALYLELYELADEFYTILIEKNSDYKPELFKVDIEIQSQNNFINTLLKYNIDLDKELLDLKKWSSTMLDYFWIIGKFKDILIFNFVDVVMTDSLHMIDAYIHQIVNYKS